MTTTDGGKYVFENLPVLEEGQSYTVTISNVPERFKPTEPNVGEDTSVDSSTGSATSGALTEDGAHDPTLDFGFVLKTPQADIIKADADNRDANEAANAVNLVDSDGSTEIVFVIANSGEEPITNIGLVDVSTGSGTVQYPIVVTTDQGQEFTLDGPESRWDGELAIGEIATGTAQLTGVVAGEPHQNIVTLWADGALTGQPVEDPENPSDNPEEPNRPEDPYNAVVEPTPSVTVGDFVWDDENGDGIQGPNEPGIPGVVLDIYDPEGEKIGSTTTNEEGNYKFTDLPVLEDGQSYTVKVNYEESKDALGDRVPTESGAGDDPARDSSTDEAQTTGLTEDGQEDLTLDFGFIDPSVEVGDKVWLDTNGDGRQDDGEPGIPGVVLNIVGPDGQPVTDVYGNTVGPVTTDESGNYLFTDLPTLADGESYKVVVDQDASADALKGFVPTKAGEGDRAGDSSTWEATTQGLTGHGDADLTLDFGFVPVEDDVEVPTPTPNPDPVDPEDPKDKDDMPDTGLTSLIPAIAGLALLLLGAGLVFNQRRKRNLEG